MCVCVREREEDGSCLHNHTLALLWWPPAPPPPPLSHPVPPSFASSSLWAFLTENNGVTSCSRSECFQHRFQAGAHLDRGSEINCKVYFFYPQHKDSLHMFFCVIAFHDVWLFLCFDVYMNNGAHQGFSNINQLFFPTFQCRLPSCLHITRNERTSLVFFKSCK